MNTWMLDSAIARLLSTNAVVLTEQPNSQMVGKPECYPENGVVAEIAAPMLATLRRDSVRI